MNFFLWAGVCVLIVLVGYGVFSFVRIEHLIQESAVLVRQAVPFEHMVAPEKGAVLFVGDSTGVGVGADSANDSLAGRYSDDHPDVSVYNRAVSGAKTAAVSAQLAGYHDNSFDTVIIQIGGNDITYFTDLSALKTDIEQLLLRAHRVGKKVILLSCGNVSGALIFPRPIAFLWEKRTRQVREVFMTAAETSHTHYVDLFHEDRRSDPFFTDPYHYHAADLFHPSSLGYGLWYKELKKAL